ncbi:MAG: membrane-bound lytic murein transglycosylase MltF [Oceanospirillaceae bacterium]
MIRKTHSFYYIAFILSICLLMLLTFKLDNQQNTQLVSILKNNTLRVSSTNSADTYFLDKNKPAGFEYELADAFANSLGVTLDFAIKKDIEQLSTDLVNRDSHISIPGRSKSAKPNSKIQLSDSYTSNQTVVIYRETRGIKYPRGVINIVDRSIILAADSLQEQQLELQLAAFPNLSWISSHNLTTYEILERVFSKETDIAIISQTEFTAIGPFFPSLKVAFELGEPQAIAWQLANKTDTSLKNALNKFLSKESTIAFIKSLDKKYYQNSNPLNFFDTVTFKNDFNNRLPDLEPYFKLAAKNTNIDWLLLAAIAYQESHWNSKAVSSTGVKGIMMLTKAAAKEVKVTDRTDPKQSILGGAQYLLNVKTKIPSRIQDPDRTFLALAGYNTGFGHLEDARILTKRAGLNPDIWENVSKKLPLLTKAKYYNTVKHGYARGYEPVNYVKNIKQYLIVLRWEIEQQQLKNEKNIAPITTQTTSGDNKEETITPTAPSTL